MDSGSFHLSDADDEEQEEAVRMPDGSLPMDADGEGGGGGVPSTRAVALAAGTSAPPAALATLSTPAVPATATASAAAAATATGEGPPASPAPAPAPANAASASPAPTRRRLSEEEELAAALRASVARPVRDSLFTSASAIPRLAPLPPRRPAEDGAAGVGGAGPAFASSAGASGAGGLAAAGGSGAGGVGGSGSGSGNGAASGSRLSGTPVAPSSSSASSTRRIAWELRDVSKNGCAEGISASIVDDNLYLWEVSVSFRDASDRLNLAADLRALGTDSVVFEVRFGSDFPYSPPFLRVLRPRFRPQTTYVLPGGGLCLQVITSAGWSPAMTLLNLFISVKSTLSISSARLDTRDHRPYGSAAEAMRTLSRAAAIHNWALPTGHFALATEEGDAAGENRDGGSAEGRNGAGGAASAGPPWRLVGLA
ncbi:hypothetical protein I4F81_000566 [Pyropia yezoensis]|uniref:Uncharacterized protein n=1 Tax=Pyropia yezoensis TaxID=2788 RepID=A0ACC3BKC9_PYRYE|nr:hypothetical protein I4F81_000566 [Neopyropia yezoensis]